MKDLYCCKHLDLFSLCGCCRLDDFALALISLQETQTALDTSVKVDLRTIERKMEDTVQIASSHVGSMQVQIFLRAPSSI